MNGHTEYSSRLQAWVIEPRSLSDRSTLRTFHWKRSFIHLRLSLSLSLSLFPFLSSSFSLHFTWLICHFCSCTWWKGHSEKLWVTSKHMSKSLRACVNKWKNYLKNLWIKVKLYKLTFNQSKYIYRWHTSTTKGVRPCSFSFSFFLYPSL